MFVRLVKRLLVSGLDRVEKGLAGLSGLGDEAVQKRTPAISLQPRCWS